MQCEDIKYFLVGICIVQTISILCLIVFVQCIQYTQHNELLYNNTYPVNCSSREDHHGLPTYAMSQQMERMRMTSNE